MGAPVAAARVGRRGCEGRKSRGSQPVLVQPHGYVEEVVPIVVFGVKVVF